MITRTVRHKNLTTLGLLCAIQKRYPDWFWVSVDNLLLDLSPLVNRIERETCSLPSGTQAKIGALLHTLLIGRRDKPSGTFQIRIQIISLISEPRIFQRLTYKNLHTKISITETLP